MMSLRISLKCPHCANPIPQPKNYFEKSEYFEDVTCSECGNQITEADKLNQLKSWALNEMVVNKPMQPIGRTV